MNNNQLHIMHAIHENQVLLENIRSDFHSTIRLCAFRLHFSDEKIQAKDFLRNSSRFSLELFACSME